MNMRKVRENGKERDAVFWGETRIDYGNFESFEAEMNYVRHVRQNLASDLLKWVICGFASTFDGIELFICIVVCSHILRHQMEKENVRKFFCVLLIANPLCWPEIYCSVSFSQTFCLQACILISEWDITWDICENVTYKWKFYFETLFAYNVWTNLFSFAKIPLVPNVSDFQKLWIFIFPLQFKKLTRKKFSPNISNILNFTTILPKFLILQFGRKMKWNLWLGLCMSCCCSQWNKSFLIYFQRWRECIIWSVAGSSDC